MEMIVLVFEIVGNFLDAIKNWKTPNGAVTYLVTSIQQVPKLCGAFISSTLARRDRLGGQDGRLWNYQYAVSANKTEFRVRECVKKLVADGARYLFGCVKLRLIPLQSCSTSHIYSENTKLLTGGLPPFGSEDSFKSAIPLGCIFHPVLFSPPNSVDPLWITP